MYPLSAPNSLSKPAIDAAIRSLKSGRYTMGAHVKQFEQDFAQWTGAKHAVMVNSGSSANLLAVEAMMRPSDGHPRWHAGDQVLVPALAWSTTVFPLIQLGLQPVFVDVDPDTLALDLHDAERALQSNRRVVGMVLIHVLGLAANLADYQAFCERHDLTLIEDCCEAFGAFHQGQSVGTAGLIGTFSHYFSHQLTTIEGGTVITNDDAIADDLRSMRAHGWTRDRSDKAAIETGSGIDSRFLFCSTGYNVRPMDLQGAIGVEQLAEADKHLRRRYVTVINLIEALKVVPWLRVIGANYLAKEDVNRRQRRHSWMNLPILVEPNAPMTAATVMLRLQAAGIETRPILAGNITRHPGLRSATTFVQPFPVADRIMRHGFMIGCHPARKTVLAKIQRALATLESVAA